MKKYYTYTAIIILIISLIFIISCAEKTPPELLNPDEAELKAPAPETYKVKFETSKGDFIIEVYRTWSPNGADRLYYLANHSYYNNVRFFRVIGDFMAQFGYHGDPEVIKVWSTKSIPDDSVVASNKRGYVTFAKKGIPDSRSTQLYINYSDNIGLDAQGFSPIGKVIEGMDVVDNLYKGYGDGAPRGSGPSQAKIMREGNKYLKKNFPKLDYIKKAYVISE